MRYILVFLSVLFYMSSNAQGTYTPDATKKRFSQGIIAFGGIGDTANFKTAVDSNVLIYQRSNGKLYFRRGTTYYIELSTSDTLSKYLLLTDTSKLVSGYQLRGNIYTGSDFISLSGLSQNGLTSLISMGNISVSTSGFTSTKSLDVDGYTASEYWHAYVRFKVNQAGNDTSYGIGVGVRSFNSTFNSGAFGWIDLTNHSGAGKVKIQNTSSSPATIDSSTSTISYSNGDSLEVWFERSGNVFTATGRNITQNGGPVSISRIYNTYPFPISPPNIPNTGKFSIFSLGGSFSIDSINVSSREITYPDILLFGDSKFVGYFSHWNYRLASWLMRIFLRVAVNAGSGDKTEEAILRLPEVINAHPKRVLIDLGTNNQLADSNIVKTNYQTIVNTLRAAGIPVYHTVLYQADQLWRWNWIKRTYSADSIINTFDPLRQPAAMNGIHPTDYGNQLAFNAVVNSNFFNGTKSEQISEAGNLVGTTLADNITTSSITSLGTLSALTVSGNITSTNLTTGNLTATNVSANSISGTALQGTLGTAAQPNVTSVGSLTSLTVNGVIYSAGITTTGSVLAGNISSANGISATSINIVGTNFALNYSTASSTTALVESWTNGGGTTYKGIDNSGGSFTGTPYASLVSLPAGRAFIVLENSVPIFSVIGGKVSSFVPVQLPLYTVASLPTCGAGQTGQIAFVIDALAPSFLVTVVGGGTIKTQVSCNGSTWVSQ